MKSKRFIAIGLLLVLLLGAALPTSAATSSFDGTSDTNQMDLVITEMLVNSKTGVTGLDDVLASGSVSVFSSPDAFDYIEIYNRGNTVVNIYDYVILSAPSLDFAGINKQNDAVTNASNKYKFTMKNIIVPGVSIHSTNAGAASGSRQDYNECVNPERARGNIAPGEFAVIWFWTSETDTVCRALGASANVGESYANDSRTFPYFRDYYGIADDVKIFATNAKTSNSEVDTFNDLRPNWIYALTLNTSGANPISYNDYAVKNNKLNDRIACMAEYSNSSAVGMVAAYDTAGTYIEDNMDDVSAYYVPASCVPDLYNVNASCVWEELYDDYGSFQPASNYVDIGYARSFRESAIVSFSEYPTPGSMPAWQWLYIDPIATGSGNYVHGLPVQEEKIYYAAVAAAEKDAEVIELFNAAMAKVVSDWQTNGAIKNYNGRLKSDSGYDSWQNAAMQDYLQKYAAEFTEELPRVEVKTDYSENFVTREELERRNGLLDETERLPVEEDGGAAQVQAEKSSSRWGLDGILARIKQLLSRVFSFLGDDE